MAPPRTDKESVERAISPRWMDTFGDLKRFIKKHDRLPYKDENKALCIWACRQRGYSKGRDRGRVLRGLLQEERKLLESVGFFNFESRFRTPRIAPIWHAKYEKLKRSNGTDICDSAIRLWLREQQKQSRKGSLQPMKVKLLDDLPFDWMLKESIGENPRTRRSPPSSSGRSQLATKPTTVVHEALLPPSADSKPAAGDFPPGWMQQSKPRSSGRMDHYWISPAGKRFLTKKKALQASTEKCDGGRASSAARLNTCLSARKERKGKAADSHQNQFHEYGLLSLGGSGCVKASAPSRSITSLRSRATSGTSSPPRWFLGTWSLEELSKRRCGDCTNCNREHCRDCDSCKRAIGGEYCLRRVSSIICWSDALCFSNI
jgi:hypothetical protein